jgi:hypothetical protein
MRITSAFYEHEMHPKKAAPFAVKTSVSSLVFSCVFPGGSRSDRAPDLAGAGKIPASEQLRRQQLEASSPCCEAPHRAEGGSEAAHEQVDVRLQQ